MIPSKYEVWCRKCGCLMKIRRGKYGEFYGCTGYPKCFNTMNLRDAELEASGDVDQDELDMPRYDRD